MWLRLDHYTKEQKTQTMGEGCGCITTQRLRRHRPWERGVAASLHKGSDDTDHRSVAETGSLHKGAEDTDHGRGVWLHHYTKAQMTQTMGEECGCITTQRLRRHRPWERGVAASLHKGSDDTDHGRGVWLHHYTKAQTTQTMGEGCGCGCTRVTRSPKPRSSTSSMLGITVATSSPLWSSARSDNWNF